MKTLAIFFAAVLLFAPSSPDFCKKTLMSAYFLDGLLIPTLSKVPLCPSLKNNCCTSKDVIKIFDKFNNILKPRLRDFKLKFEASLLEIEKMQQLILRIVQKNTWQGEQQGFCAPSYAKFVNYPFAELMIDLRKGFMSSFDYFDKLHQSYLCTFCDYDAQSQILLSTQTMVVDGTVCLNSLNTNRHFLAAQNIRLTQFYQIVHQHLSCLLYETNFNIPFIYGTQADLLQDFTSCFAVLSNDSLDPKCKPLCNNLFLGGTSPVFEGNYLFISRANFFYNDMISIIQTKQNATSFDPMAALQLMNSQNDVVKFFNVPNKTVTRTKAFKSRNNNFPVREKNQDDVFRNDLSRYVPNPDDEDDDSTGSEDVYKNRAGTRMDQFIKTRVSRRRRFPTVRSKGTRRKPSKQTSVLVANWKKRAAAAGNFLRQTQPEGTGVNVVRNNLILLDRKLKQEKRNLKKMKVLQKKSKSISVLNIDGTFTMLENGDSLSNGITNNNGVLFKNGEPLETKIPISKMNPPIKYLKEVVLQISKSLPTKKKENIQTKTGKKLTRELLAKPIGNAKKEKVDKPNKELRKVVARIDSNNKQTEKIEVKKRQGFISENKEQVASKNDRSLQKTIVSASKKHDAQIPETQKVGSKITESDKSVFSSPVTQNLIKIDQVKSPQQKEKKESISFLLGKKSIPTDERKLLNKMAKIIDTQFQKKQSKTVKPRRQRFSPKLMHKRILKEFFHDEPASFHRIKNGRILKETDPDIDPMAVLYPSAYYSALYDSFLFLQNTTSQEIYKNNINVPDLIYFKRTFVSNQGINTDSYVASLNFEVSRNQLLVLIKGKTNLDPLDSTMLAIINSTSTNFLSIVMTSLAKEFTIIIQPEYFSKDDKDWLRMEPVYENQELLDTIDYQFFDDRFVSKIQNHMTTPFVQSKRIYRSLMQLNSARESAGNMQELRKQIRPNLFKEHQLSKKEIF